MSKKRVAVTLRKPQASADIESFVASEPAAPLPPVAAVVPEPAVAERAITHATRSYRELTLYLPSELVQRLSLYCIDHDLDLNRLIAEAASKHLDAGAAAPHKTPGWQDLLESLVREYRGKLSGLLARGPFAARG